MTGYHLVNSQAYLLFTAVYGGNEYGKSGYLSIFTLLKHLLMRLKYIFQGFILHLINDTAW